MKKITKYEVVSLELNDGFLCDKVNEKDFTKLIEQKIEKGFQPYGELIMSIETSSSFLGGSSYTRMTQVMVKYEYQYKNKLWN